jgi:ABC-2 type transport system permease protein
MTSHAAEPASISLARRRGANAVLAIVRRDYLITRSYRLVFIFDAFFTVVNLLVAYFVSRTFNGVASANLGGAPTYFDFAAVGLSLSAVVSATTLALAQRVREEQLAGTLEALLAQPVRPAEFAFGLAGFPITFATIRTAAYLLVGGSLLGLELSRANWPAFLVMLGVTAAAFASIGILAGAFVLVVKRGEMLVGLGMSVMGIVSGAVFPISVLPGWVRWISDIVPTRYAFEGVRGALYGAADWHHDALVLAVFSVVALPLAVGLFTMALAAARRAGSLGQY